MDITLCRFKTMYGVGLLDTLGHFCGINYVWILKIFQVWSVLV